MVKNHMKRLAAPKSWAVHRKLTAYITKPRPGAHSYKLGMPLNVVIKELLKLANTSREVKEIIKTGVSIDGKKVIDERSIIGFMDVLSFIHSKEAYRILLNNNGFITPVKIEASESKIKLSKIIGKNLVNGKTQLNLNDGRNLLVDKDGYRCGDILLIEIPNQKILEKIPLEKGSKIYLMGGKHIGEIHTAETITGEKISLRSKDGSVFETLKKYAFAVGKDKVALSSVEKLSK
ncbi:30S ribosomal protein S4e [Candidatus Woesearchaeota archaeon]|nr:30S ribosomal protein S4e [Candidatus Woesearchaeota archaeon]